MGLVINVRESGLAGDTKRIRVPRKAGGPKERIETGVLNGYHAEVFREMGKQALESMRTRYMPQNPGVPFDVEAHVGPEQMPHQSAVALINGMGVVDVDGVIKRDYNGYLGAIDFSKNPGYEISAYQGSDQTENIEWMLQNPDRNLHKAEGVEEAASRVLKYVVKLIKKSTGMDVAPDIKGRSFGDDKNIWFEVITPYESGLASVVAARLVDPGAKELRVLPGGEAYRPGEGFHIYVPAHKFTGRDSEGPPWTESIDVDIGNGTPRNMDFEKLGKLASWQ
ncbi:MAG: hypothetical protein JSW08_02865 [archaeon]|nr:MAG: hypothetical protein JSW08_02865 [archaeon]